ncbi:MAG: DUF2520 domain-containing protein [Bacteroidales bacterium]|nr:DUF2520 domain-containing protein [Bacteroidales bacterium]
MSQQNIQSVVIIGAGNVAWHVARKLDEAGIHILQIVSRSLSSSKPLADAVHAQYAGNLHSVNRNADAYIISVSDDAISKVIRDVEFDDHIAIHTAGSVTVEVFQPFARHYGILYPLQTFTKGRDVEFREVPFLIEASDPDTLSGIRKLAGLLSDHVVETSDMERCRIHLAAVFACNFTNHMFAVAEMILKQAGLSYELLKPLMRETLKKAMEGSPADVQTGPAIRGNFEVMDRHIAMLERDPELQELYRLISKNIASAEKKTKH